MTLYGIVRNGLRATSISHGWMVTDKAAKLIILYDFLSYMAFCNLSTAIYSVGAESVLACEGSCSLITSTIRESFSVKIGKPLFRPHSVQSLQETSRSPDWFAYITISTTADTLDITSDHSHLLRGRVERIREYRSLGLRARP